MYQIIQGSRTDASQNPFYVRLPANPFSGDPFDLTGVTAIQMVFTNADGSLLTLGLGTGISISGSPLIGKLLVTLTAAQTALLGITDGNTLEVTITFSGDPLKVLLPNAYSVAA